MNSCESGIISPNEECKVGRVQLECKGKFFKIRKICYLLVFPIKSTTLLRHKK